jgi:hypothetical protein
MGLITMLASAAAEGSKAAEEHSTNSYTLFYVIGGALAVFAVLVSIVGMSRAEFPGTGAAGKALMSLSVLLAAAAMGAAVYVTS